MPKITMYSTAVCPYCINAERLLNSKGIMDIEKIRIDMEPERRGKIGTDHVLSGQVYLILPDHLDAPRAIINTAGQAVWRWDNLEPFGDTPRQ